LKFFDSEKFWASSKLIFIFFQLKKQKPTPLTHYHYHCLYFSAVQTAGWRKEREEEEEDDEEEEMAHGAGVRFKIKKKCLRARRRNTWNFFGFFCGKNQKIKKIETLQFYLIFGGKGQKFTKKISFQGTYVLKIFENLIIIWM
jgi:hypothetical protein